MLPTVGAEAPELPDNSILIPVFGVHGICLWKEILSNLLYVFYNAEITLHAQKLVPSLIYVPLIKIAYALSQKQFKWC